MTIHRTKTRPHLLQKTYLLFIKHKDYLIIFLQHFVLQVLAL